MSPVSLIEKLQNVKDMMASSPLYFVALLLVLVLVYLFSTTSSSNKKQSKKTYFLIYGAIFLYLIIQYGSGFGTMIDYAVNQVFFSYYFPNIVFYLIMLVITNIILWVSIFKDTVSKPIKIFNSIVYGILIYFFILALSTITKLNLNVFDMEALYSSDKLRSVIELSMFVFVLWSLVLTVYHFIRKYQTKKNIVKVEEVTNYELIPDFKEDKVYAPKREPVFFPQPIVEEPVKKEEPFTLEEYKLMLEILKEEKQKEEQKYNPLSDLNKLYQSIGE